MPTETGRVVAVEGVGLWVETIRRSTCGGCAAQKGCGHGLLDRLFESRRGHIRVLTGDRTSAHYRVGDQVVISLASGVLARGSFVAYGLPLLAMLAGALAAVYRLPGNEDLVAVSGAAVGLLSGYAVVRWHGARHCNDPAYQPVLLGPAPSIAEPVNFS